MCAISHFTNFAINVTLSITTIKIISQANNPYNAISLITKSAQKLDCAFDKAIRANQVIRISLLIS